MAVGSVFGRVTSGMASASMLSHLTRSSQDLFITQQQISSGMRILTPSMDANGTADYLRSTSRMYRNSSYLQTAGNLRNTYSFIDSQLGDGTGVINSLKTVALREANDISADAQTRQASITELSSLRASLLSFANAQLGGLSVFGGRNTTGEAFTLSGDAVVFRGSNDVNKLSIEDGLEISASLEASQVFGQLETTSGARSSLNPAITLAATSPTTHGTPSTSIASLNGGRGVDLAPLTVTVYPNGAANGAGMSYSVDLRGARTVSDIVEAFSNVRGKDGNPVFQASIQAAAGATYPLTAESLMSGLRLEADGELASAIASRPSEIRFFSQEGRTTAQDLGLTTGQLSYGITSQPLAGPFNQTFSFNVDANGKQQSFSITPAGSTVADLATAINTQLNTALRTAGMYGFTVSATANGDSLDLAISDTAGTGSLKLTGNDAASIAIADAISAGSVTTQPSFNRGSASFSSGVFAGRDLNPALSATTPLSTLAGGAGLKRAVDAAGNGLAVDGLRITNGALSGDINLADLLSNPNATVNDLINRINGSGLQVSARIAASGDRIEIVSRQLGVPLRVENLNGTLGSQLGVDTRFSEMRTSDLNGGLGLNTVDGVDFRATTSSGTTVDFDLGNATTVGGIINAINSATGNRLPDGSQAFSASAVAERRFSSDPLAGALFGVGGASPIGFEVSLNGQPARTITLTGPFADRDALSTALEDAVNGVAGQLGMTGFSTSVIANNDDGSLSFRVTDSNGPASINFSGGDTALFGLGGTVNTAGVRSLPNETLSHRVLLKDNTWVTGGAQPNIQNVGESTVVNDLGLAGSDAVRVQTTGTALAPAFDATQAFSLTVDLPRGPQLTVNVPAMAGRSVGAMAEELAAAINTAATGAGIEGYSASARIDSAGALVVETTDGLGSGSIAFSGVDAATLGIGAGQVSVSDPAMVIFNFATGSFEGSAQTLRGSASDNIFTAVNDLMRSLENNSGAGISATLNSFDRALERMLAAQTETGVRSKRIELAENRLGRENDTLTEKAASVMETDLAEAASRMARQQTMFQAAVQTSAQILRISVLDYL